jgi:hypothetical protein
MGSSYTPAFSQTGYYTISLDVYMDGNDYYFEKTVHVESAPTTAPAAPLVNSTIADGNQTLDWTPGDGVAAFGYEVLDPSGAVLTTLKSNDGEDSNGYELVLPAAEGGLYSVVAVNAVGSTPGTYLVTADDATYTHASLDGGVPVGGALQLSGKSSQELQHALESGSSPIDLMGNYSALYVSPNGDSFPVDMTGGVGSITGGSSWSATLTVRDSLTTGDASLSDLMDDGLADEILAGGYVEFAISGQRVRVEVAADASVAHLDQYVVDSDSPQPSGVTVSGAVSDQTAGAWSFDAADGVADLPFVVGTPDPAHDWSEAAIANVHTWIGNEEVDNTLTSGSLTVDGSEAVTSTEISFTGDVAGGSSKLDQQFLQNGAISFTVNGGDPNVLLFRLSAADAKYAYPDLAPPAPVGRANVSFPEFDSANWRPTIKWGGSDPGSVFEDGDLPEGMSWDAQTMSLSGTPTVQGTFPITITALGSTGQGEKTYNITVGPSYEGHQTVIGTPGDWDDGDGTWEFWVDATGYFRADNPAFEDSLPLLSEYDGEVGELNGTADNVTIADPDGTPLPIAGDFTIEIWRNQDGTDSIDFYGINLIPTSGTATIPDLLAGGGSVTFQYDSGDPNTIQFGPMS